MKQDNKKVKMAFQPVNYRAISPSANKTELILNEYDQLLFDLMSFCLQKGNNITLRVLVKLIRRTPWYITHKCEAFADYAETTYLNLAIPLTDDADIVLPDFVTIRILRVGSIIAEAIEAQALEYFNALPLNRTERELRSMLEDLKSMQSYLEDLSFVLSSMNALNGASVYYSTYRCAQGVLDEVYKSVDKRLNPPAEANEK